MQGKGKGTARRVLAILLLAAVAAWTAGCVEKPQDVLIKPQSRPLVESKLDEKVIQLVTESYIPFSYEENGVVRGIAVDVVTELFKRLDYTAEIKLLPWTRSLQMVQDGDTDGIFCAFYSDERAIYMDYMKEPLAYEALYCYSLKDSPVVFDGTMTSLKPYRIGVIQDWYYGAEFESAAKSGLYKIQNVTDIAINIQKLIEGRIDVIVNPRMSTLYYMKKLQVQDMLLEQTVPFREPTALYLGFTKKRYISPALRDELEAELVEMKKDGTYQQIVDHYTR